jgi:hypothetical protein
VISHQPRQLEIAGGIGQLPRELIGGHVRPIGGERLVTVVDQDVNFAGKIHCRGESLGERLGLHVIEGQAEVPSVSHDRQRTGRRFGFGLFAAGEYDAGPGLGQRPGHRRAQVPAAAGE